MRSPRGHSRKRCGRFAKGRTVSDLCTHLSANTYSLPRRFVNIDYIFLSCVMGLLLLFITVSYDIVCQWKINLASRLPNLPSHVTENLQDPSPLPERLHFGVPVWHAMAHEEKCQVENSLRYQPGWGHTDGEGIERGWSRINPISLSTKEMGEGARHDTLDDHFGYHNWQRNITLGMQLHIHCHFYSPFSH